MKLEVTIKSRKIVLQDHTHIKLYEDMMELVKFRDYILNILEKLAEDGKISVSYNSRDDFTYIHYKYDRVGIRSQKKVVKDILKYSFHNDYKHIKDVMNIVLHSFEKVRNTEEAVMNIVDARLDKCFFESSRIDRAIERMIMKIAEIE